MPDQYDLFSGRQDEHLKRVTSAIAGSIMAFATLRFARGREFHMAELLAHVRRDHPIAPDSPSRILRELRKQGRLDYVVINRRQSHYRLTKVN